MDHLDDLPKHDDNHKTQEIAETAFRDSISERSIFIIQREDRRDYGTDFQLEVVENCRVTNIRVHVQLKGTKSEMLSDKSVSRVVARANLNYLLHQPCSIYVCYHEPTGRLLVRYAEDVYRAYEHKGTTWRSQSSITVGFIQLFDAQFQKDLKNRASSLAKSSRDDRLLLASHPPNQLSKILAKSSEKIIVPTGSEQAKVVLKELYDLGKDEVISNSFDQFLSELNSSPKDMMFAYMAEINLGINGLEFDEDRVRTGITELEKLLDLKYLEKGSLLYSIGNGWLALKNYEKAKGIYHLALCELDRPELSSIAAQCYKNMGAVMEHLGNADNVAIEFYQRSLELYPQLSETHFALALCYRREQDFQKVLEHLDQVIFTKSSDQNTSSLQGWRIEALFNEGEIKAAFREINSLVTLADKFDWVWSWCAQQVITFGRDSLLAAQKAIQFWNVYLQKDPKNFAARRERLLCFWYRRSCGEITELDFVSFKKQANELIDSESFDVAFLWDRIGHWAQYDGDWLEAEKCYRKAYELEPNNYGYCFGTALNFLGRYEEALPILLEQAENYLPDEMSWFQVAVAREGVNDIPGCLSAYKKAIELNPEYDLAWFNLGGVYWNSGNKEKAIDIWHEAVERFPEHELAEKLRNEFPTLFG